MTLICMVIKGSWMSSPSIHIYAVCMRSFCRSIKFKVLTHPWKTAWCLAIMFWGKQRKHIFDARVAINLFAIMDRCQQIRRRKRLFRTHRNHSYHLPYCDTWLQFVRFGNTNSLILPLCLLYVVRLSDATFERNLQLLANVRWRLSASYLCASHPCNVKSHWSQLIYPLSAA